MPRMKQFNEEAVLAKAMELFWKQGFNGTSMQELVEHLGINRASLYSTFGDKKALFDKAFAQYRANSAATINQCFENGNTLREKLLNMYTMVIDGAIGNGEAKGCFVVNATGELTPDNACMRNRLAENKKGFEDQFMQLLKEAVARGELSPQKDLDGLVAMLIAIHNGLPMIAKVDPNREKLLSGVHAALSILE